MYIIIIDLLNFLDQNKKKPEIDYSYGSSWTIKAFIHSELNRASWKRLSFGYQVRENNVIISIHDKHTRKQFNRNAIKRLSDICQC